MLHATGAEYGAAAARFRSVASHGLTGGGANTCLGAFSSDPAILEPTLQTLAHEGSKAYSDSFDLVYRPEAAKPYTIGQADQRELDIWILREDATPKKPWLTIVFDDSSRAVAGFCLFFGAPSPIQTAQALGQAIWRKPQGGWHVCEIPQVHYTNLGNDFTSQHLEQVVAHLKIQLIRSGVSRPRGRGKIARFFETLIQAFLPCFPASVPRVAAHAKRSLRGRIWTASWNRFCSPSIT
ncbi:MAG TPA: hypothetical protein VKU02_23645 [Gemmataceae bacterium]|nr:hypothetical protein [Gemmataceae bacterium]